MDQIGAKTLCSYLIGAPGCVEPVLELFAKQIILRFDVISVPTELEQRLDDGLALVHQDEITSLLQCYAQEHIDK